jgi:predicted TIM-barrel enzyme
MNRVAEVFGVSRVLLPVVHPIGRAEALASVEVAVAAGVKGVFLINQGMSDEKVLALINEVRGLYPRLWVGLNLLGSSPEETLRRGLAACAGRLDGIWTDDADIHEDRESQPRAQRFVAARQQLGWTGLLFGGVAFKYQREVPADKLGRAAAVAAGYMDVVCTSGPGTGQEAQVEKVAALRAGLGSTGALALASGVTAHNVGRFLPHVDAFLVGTGIEQKFGVLDPDKVVTLQRLIAAAARG